MTIRMCNWWTLIAKNFLFNLMAIAVFLLHFTWNPRERGWDGKKCCHSHFLTLSHFTTEPRDERHFCCNLTYLSYTISLFLSVRWMSRGGIKSLRISLPFLDFGIIGWDGCSSLFCDFEGENFIADKSSCMWRHLSVIFSILMMIFGPKKLKTISKSLSLCCFHSYECSLSILAWRSPI